MTTRRVVLVGYGFGGSVFHAPCIAVTPGLELAAIVTADPVRRAAAAERWPGVELLPSFDVVEAAPHRYDLVVVSTANRTHRPLAERALRAGLHVVLDKPVTATVDDARALAGVAAATDRLLVPFHNRRLDGDFRTVRRLLDEGALGRVLRFESRYERWRPEASNPRSPWKEDPAPDAAGGILYDLGVHLIDQALVLFGRPARVAAEIDVRRQAARTDDDVFVALEYPGGLRVHLWASLLAADLGPRFRVLGTDAAFVKYGMDPQEDALRAGHLPIGAGWGEDPEFQWGRLGTPGTTAAVVTEPGAYPDFYAGVVAALAGEGDPPVAVADAIAGLEVVAAARRAAATGAVVPLGDTPPGMPESRP